MEGSHSSPPQKRGAQPTIPCWQHPGDNSLWYVEEAQMKMEGGDKSTVEIGDSRTLHASQRPENLGGGRRTAQSEYSPLESKPPSAVSRSEAGAPTRKISLAKSRHDQRTADQSTTAGNAWLEPTSGPVCPASIAPRQLSHVFGETRRCVDGDDYGEAALPTSSSKNAHALRAVRSHPSVSFEQPPASSPAKIAPLFPLETAGGSPDCFTGRKSYPARPLTAFTDSPSSLFLRCSSSVSDVRCGPNNTAAPSPSLSPVSFGNASVPSSRVPPPGRGNGPPELRHFVVAKHGQGACVFSDGETPTHRCFKNDDVASFSPQIISAAVSRHLVELIARCRSDNVRILALHELEMHAQSLLLLPEALHAVLTMLDAVVRNDVGSGPAVISLPATLSKFRRSNKKEGSMQPVPPVRAQKEQQLSASPRAQGFSCRTVTDNTKSRGALETCSSFNFPSDPSLGGLFSTESSSDFPPDLSLDKPILTHSSSAFSPDAFSREYVTASIEGSSEGFYSEDSVLTAASSMQFPQQKRAPAAIISDSDDGFLVSDNSLCPLSSPSVAADEGDNGLCRRRRSFCASPHVADLTTRERISLSELPNSSVIRQTLDVATNKREMMPMPRADGNTSFNHLSHSFPAGGDREGKNIITCNRCDAVFNETPIPAWVSSHAKTLATEEPRAPPIILSSPGICSVAVAADVAAPAAPTKTAASLSDQKHYDTVGEHKQRPACSRCPDIFDNWSHTQENANLGYITDENDVAYYPIELAFPYSPLSRLVCMRVYTSLCVTLNVLCVAPEWIDRLVALLFVLISYHEETYISVIFRRYACGCLEELERTWPGVLLPVLSTGGGYMAPLRDRLLQPPVQNITVPTRSGVPFVGSSNFSFSSESYPFSTTKTSASAAGTVALLPCGPTFHGGGASRSPSAIAGSPELPAWELKSSLHYSSAETPQPRELTDSPLESPCYLSRTSISPAAYIATRGVTSEAPKASAVSVTPHALTASSGTSSFRRCSISDSSSSSSSSIFTTVDSQRHLSRSPHCSAVTANKFPFSTDSASCSRPQLPCGLHLRQRLLLPPLPPPALAVAPEWLLLLQTERQPVVLDALVNLLLLTASQGVQILSNAAESLSVLDSSMQPLLCMSAHGVATTTSRSLKAPELASLGFHNTTSQQQEQEQQQQHEQEEEEQQQRNSSSSSNITNSNSNANEALTMTSLFPVSPLPLAAVYISMDTTTRALLPATFTHMLQILFSEILSRFWELREWTQAQALHIFASCTRLLPGLPAVAGQNSFEALMPLLYSHRPPLLHAVLKLAAALAATDVLDVQHAQLVRLKMECVCINRALKEHFRLLAVRWLGALLEIRMFACLFFEKPPCFLCPSPSDSSLAQEHLLQLLLLYYRLKRIFLSRELHRTSFFGNGVYVELSKKHHKQQQQLPTMLKQPRQQQQQLSYTKNKLQHQRSISVCRSACLPANLVEVCETLQGCWRTDSTQPIGVHAVLYRFLLRLLLFPCQGLRKQVHAFLCEQLRLSPSELMNSTLAVLHHLSAFEDMSAGATDEEIPPCASCRKRMEQHVEDVEIAIQRFPAKHIAPSTHLASFSPSSLSSSSYFCSFSSPCTLAVPSVPSFFPVSLPIATAVAPVSELRDVSPRPLSFSAMRSHISKSTNPHDIATSDTVSAGRKGTDSCTLMKIHQEDEEQHSSTGAAAASSLCLRYSLSLVPHKARSFPKQKIGMLSLKYPATPFSSFSASSFSTDDDKSYFKRPLSSVDLVQYKKLSQRRHVRWSIRAHTLLLSLSDMLKKLEPPSRISFYIPLLLRLSEEAAVSPNVLLHALGRLVDSQLSSTSPLEAQQQWDMGMHILTVCKQLLSNYSQPELLQPMSELLLRLADATAVLDVRDNALLLLNILLHAGPSMLRALLRPANARLSVALLAQQHLTCVSPYTYQFVGGVPFLEFRKSFREREVLCGLRDGQAAFFSLYAGCEGSFSAIRQPEQIYHRHYESDIQTVELLSDGVTCIGDPESRRVCFSGEPDTSTFGGPQRGQRKHSSSNVLERNEQSNFHQLSEQSSPPRMKKLSCLHNLETQSCCHLSERQLHSRPLVKQSHSRRLKKQSNPHILERQSYDQLLEKQPYSYMLGRGPCARLSKESSFLLSTRKPTGRSGTGNRRARLPQGAPLENREELLSYCCCCCNDCIGGWGCGSLSDDSAVAQYQMFVASTPFFVRMPFCFRFKPNFYWQLLKSPPFSSISGACVSDKTTSSTTPAASRLHCAPRDRERPTTAADSAVQQQLETEAERKEENNEEEERKQEFLLKKTPSCTTVQSLKTRERRLRGGDVQNVLTELYGIRLTFNQPPEYALLQNVHLPLLRDSNTWRGSLQQNTQCSGTKKKTTNNQEKEDIHVVTPYKYNSDCAPSSWRKIQRQDHDLEGHSTTYSCFPFMYKLVLKARNEYYRQLLQTTALCVNVRVVMHRLQPLYPVPAAIPVSVRFSDETGALYSGVLDTFTVSFQDLFLPVCAPTAFWPTLFRHFWKDPQMIRSVKILDGDHARVRRMIDMTLKPFLVIGNTADDEEIFDFEQDQYFVEAEYYSRLHDGAYIHNHLINEDLGTSDGEQWLRTADQRHSRSQDNFQEAECHEGPMFRLFQSDNILQDSKFAQRSALIRSAPAAEQAPSPSQVLREYSARRNVQIISHPSCSPLLMSSGVALTAAKGELEDALNFLNEYFFLDSYSQGSTVHQLHKTRPLCPPVEVVRAIIFLPPRHHVLLKFSISQYSTAVRIVVDRYQLLGHLDRFFAASSRTAGTENAHWT